MDNVSDLDEGMKSKEEMEGAESEDEPLASDDDDDTIARIQRAHFAQAAAMSRKRRPPPKPRRMSQKRKLEAVKSFHDFTKKLKQDTGIKIRSLPDRDLLGYNVFSSSESESGTESDGLSEEEFQVDPQAVQELNEENHSYIDPETGDIIEHKASLSMEASSPVASEVSKSPQLENTDEVSQVPKTLTISDIIDEGDLDLTKNVEIAEVEQGELGLEKTAEELLDLKQEDVSQDYDITEKLQEMGEISVKPAQNEDTSDQQTEEGEIKPEADEEKKSGNSNSILNVRRNIREVMDEKQLDASTLAAQRQESERLARVQEQQRIIREVQRQIALNRQNKVHQKTLSLLQGGTSILKKGASGQKLNLPNTVLVKLPSGETKKTTTKQGVMEATKMQKPGPSVGQKSIKPEKKEVVEIVDSSSGDETTSSSSDSDDCIMLSDSEVPPSPEAEDDPGNSGLHVNDTYNMPDEQGRVQINVGHPENEEDIFLAPQIARIIKPHQIGGVRFLFDNIIESTERFSTSSGFGCILAHSMGLGKTLQIVSFTDIFLRHTKSKTVLCIMPINTLQNWVAEFNMWLPVENSISPLSMQGEVRTRNFAIYVLNDSHKTLQMRAKVVKDWTTTGGVLMIGYELYRLLSMKKDKKPRKTRKKDSKADDKEDKKPDINEDTQGSENTNHSKQSDSSKMDDVDKPDELKEEKKDEPVDEDKKLLDEMYEALVKPGPDLVICDEGHRIKNSHSNISYALKQMRTKRRVVLTGYPLQNNLLEYWCMVDFVRPNYLGSKTEFCNMFERPIQNGQCIDSTPQDIRLMRYRAHVLHSLLVGFVQRRSHAVLQSTLPQKAEYVLLVRMTPLQRKLYDQFMNEVVRTTTVPNPLKAFAICCKIWNHPDVLYNFLKKRSEVNNSILNMEEDLDLEEIGGVTKAGRAIRSKAPPKRATKPRGSSKKPAATIPPNVNTNTAQKPNAQEINNTNNYGNPPYNQYGPPNNQYRPDQPYPTQPGYQNQPGYYPPNQGYNQNYANNYYQQQPPYGNYPNNFPPNSSDPNQGYNQNYWNNGNYYGNSGYYNNQPYPNNQPAQDYRNPPHNTPAEYNNQQQTYPQPYTPNTAPTDPAYQATPVPPFPNNQDPYTNQQRPPYPNNQQPFPNQQPYPNYPNNQPQAYPNQPYPNQYPADYNAYNPQYDPRGSNYANYQNNAQNQSTAQNIPSVNQPGPSHPINNLDPNYSQTDTKSNINTALPHTPAPENYGPNYPTYPSNIENQAAPQNIPSIQPVPSVPINNPISNYPQNEIKTEENAVQQASAPNQYGNPAYNYNNQPSTSYPNVPNPANPSADPLYPGPFNQFPPHLETKTAIGSSGSPLSAWPISDALKMDPDKPKVEMLEVKNEIKSESDNEVKIEDLDTKKIILDDKDIKKDIKEIGKIETDASKESKTENDCKKSDSKEKLSDESGSEDDSKKNKKDKRKSKKADGKRATKAKAKSKSRKDQKASKDGSDSDAESEKEEKVNREEELAMVKKAEEVTYDWATELLKDYIPGIIENSAKMELFFLILNESILLGDRLLLFSQSLFTLNLIEDYLERNYIPGTNCLWERNTNYYRLDGSTHALEREKLINEFNANPNIYLFLVSTRAGSLGINLVGANRVIVFDASWNPCHDTQAVCRVYRYGQKKPCFVYRFVMDWCLEKKIYDRQINKQGMADRVVDECNPDAVLSMKEITNLCFDNDEKENVAKDLSEHKDKYIDVVMQKIIGEHGKLLSKEPFQHESLLVDRKEKKLSSAEKRLAQRGYELEKKAALAPKPTPLYRTVRAADGTLVQRPVASVRPMQHAARWIPAEVWRRQGMTAQEMTLPLDVVIPTNSAERTNIVLKAGQRVMVLKSPKGIYMQLESGKIIAIKTSFKGLQPKGDGKDSAIGKKILNRPSPVIPGSLKNNSAITITSKSGPRPLMNRIANRQVMMGPNKTVRNMLAGQSIRPRSLTDPKSLLALRNRTPIQQAKMRPSFPGSLSITKVARKPNQPNPNLNKIKAPSGAADTHVLDSDEEKDANETTEPETANTSEVEESNSEPKTKAPVESPPANNTVDAASESSSSSTSTDSKPKPAEKEPEKITLTTEETLPSESALDDRLVPEEVLPSQTQQSELKLEQTDKSSKISLLKNYRHQRPTARPSIESSLSQLERTAIALNTEGMPDFRRNLDDITQSYSPSNEERPNTKSRKKKSPKTELPVPNEVPSTEKPGMSHSVSSMLGTSVSPKPRLGNELSQNMTPRLGNELPQNMAPRLGNELAQNMTPRLGNELAQNMAPRLGNEMAPVAPLSSANPTQPRFFGQSNPSPMMPHHLSPQGPHKGFSHSGGVMIDNSKTPPSLPPPGSSPEAAPGYPTADPYRQYPGYGMPYPPGYPAPPYYPGYAGYYPPYPGAPPAYPPAPSEHYAPPNQQW